MDVSLRIRLGLLAFFFLMAAPARSQNLLDLDAAPLLPAQPRSQKEINRLQALEHYAYGLVCERQHRLLEALDAVEQATRLDPQAAAPYKTLVSLYLALDRDADAMAASRKALELDPGDYETWYLHGRQLKMQGRLEESRQALTRAIGCPRLKENPELNSQISFELVRMLEDNQENVRSLVILENLIKSMERDKSEAPPVEVYECLARLCTNTAKMDEALRALEKARGVLEQQDPLAVPRIDFQMAKILLEQRKPAQALRHLDTYLLTQPPGTEPYELKIRLLKHLGRGDEVLKTLQEATDRDPNNATLRLFVARQYASEGQTSHAREMYLRLAADSPSPEVYRGLFSLFQSNRDMTEALDLLDRTIKEGTEREDHPGDPAARTRARAMIVALRDDAGLAKAMVSAAHDRLRRQPELEPDTRRFLAVAAVRSQQLLEAEELFRSCLEPPISPELELAIYDGLLRVLWAENKHAEIVKVCRNGLRKIHGASQLSFHSNLARALIVLGKTEDALAEVDQAVKLSDEENRLHFRILRVQILEMSDQYDRAETECHALLKEFKSPSDVRSIRYTLSGVYTAAKNYGKAEEELRRLLRDDPADASVCNDLGYILADQGKSLAEAEALIRKAIQLDRDQKPIRKAVDTENDQPNAAYIDSLGWVLFQLGKLKDARREMELAVSLPEGASDPVVWDHLGDVYFRLDEKDRARSAWQKAEQLYEIDKRRKLNDSYKELKRKLQLLEQERHH
jgi:tetratricopeptide (TPR) repeat protein